MGDGTLVLISVKTDEYLGPRLCTRDLKSYFSQLVCSSYFSSVHTKVVSDSCEQNTLQAPDFDEYKQSVNRGCTKCGELQMEGFGL